jgi:hypothetical protein
LGIKISSSSGPSFPYLNNWRWLSTLHKNLCSVVIFVNFFYWKKIEIKPVLNRDQPSITWYFSLHKMFRNSTLVFAWNGVHIVNKQKLSYSTEASYSYKYTPIYSQNVLWQDKFLISYHQEQHGRDVSLKSLWRIICYILNLLWQIVVALHEYFLLISFVFSLPFVTQVFFFRFFLIHNLYIFFFINIYINFTNTGIIRQLLQAS